jgi:hypothetical protein
MVEIFLNFRIGPRAGQLVQIAIVVLGDTLFSVVSPRLDFDVVTG